MRRGFLEQIFRNLVLGLRRHFLQFVISGIFAYSTTWTVVSSLSLFFQGLRTASWAVLPIVVGSLIFGLYWVYARQSIQIRINSLNTTINVAFGDLFKAPGMKVIPVNEFFDSQLGAPVSYLSLHGQLINHKFDNSPQNFDQQVSQDLQAAQYQKVPRKFGNTKKYPIGTTAVVEVRGDSFLLPAISRTNINTYKAYSDAPTLLTALEGLWSTVRTRAGGEPVSVPLIGTGLSGIGLPPYQLLQLIILSVIIANKEEHISSEIHIILDPKLMEEIDLETLDKQWR